jgi:LacI family sucrose operon transcriptional repressor
MKQTSIADVAKYAGVSVTTVSRVLNKRGYISEQTYQKVYDAIEHLDYYPNQLARSLFTKRTFTIGFLLPFVSYPFFASLTEQIEMTLYKKGYKLLICDTIGTEHRERDYLKMLRENKVDGIIIGNHTLDFEEYLKVSMPIVAFDIKLGTKIPAITSDHRKGGALAARKLIENGCRKVVQLKGFSREGVITTERHDEFEKQMKMHNVECNTIQLGKEDINFRLDEHRHMIHEIFEEHKNIDGFFAVDIVAARVLKYAMEKGIRVPQDLRIVGYDGTLLTQLTYPTITTVRQSCKSIAESIVKIMEKLIEGKKVPDQITYCDVELVEGGTTL